MQQKNFKIQELSSYQAAILTGMVCQEVASGYGDNSMTRYFKHEQMVLAMPYILETEITSPLSQKSIHNLLNSLEDHMSGRCADQIVYALEFVADPTYERAFIITGENNHASRLCKKFEMFKAEVLNPTSSFNYHNPWT